MPEEGPAAPINQSKVLTKPHTGKGEATSQHHHTETPGGVRRGLVCYPTGDTDVYRESTAGGGYWLLRLLLH